ncbi:MAG: hypothetical protein MUP47_03475 [Phycisphaerae bacterium]|nr:hypothetical protein [Phycisphaerae bacterium]
MRKKKDSPALFELIHKGKAKPGDLITVPDWMSGGKKPLRAPPVQPSGAEAPSPVEDLPGTGQAAALGAPDKSHRVRRLREKLLAAEGQRLRVTITPVQAILAGVAGVLLIVAVFVLGLLARHASSSSQVGQGAGPLPAQNRSERTGVGADRRESLAARTAEASGTAANGGQRSSEMGLIKGKYYLVIQGLRGVTDEHRADAEAIAQYLNSKGEPVAVMVFRGPPRQYIVVSLRGFDMTDSPDAQRYLRAIEEQGRLYSRQGGRYDFRQGERGWFVTP